MISKVERQILIALDAQSFNEGNLEMVAKMAWRLNASLAGLFVEDSRLMDVADLSFITEISSHSGEEKALQVDSLTRLNREAATRAKQIMQELSSQHEIPWSFSVEVGELVANALAQQGFDVFFPSRRRQLFTIGEMAVKASENWQLILVYEASAQFDRAVEMIHLLAIKGMVSEVTIVSESELPLEVVEQISHGGVRLSVQLIPSIEPRLLCSHRFPTTSLMILPKNRLHSLAAKDISLLDILFSYPLLLLD